MKLPTFLVLIALLAFTQAANALSPDGEDIILSWGYSSYESTIVPKAWWVGNTVLIRVDPGESFEAEVKMKDRSDVPTYEVSICDPQATENGVRAIMNFERVPDQRSGMNCAWWSNLDRSIGLQGASNGTNRGRGGNGIITNNSHKPTYHTMIIASHYNGAWWKKNHNDNNLLSKAKDELNRALRRIDRIVAQIEENGGDIKGSDLEKAREFVKAAYEISIVVDAMRNHGSNAINVKLIGPDDPDLHWYGGPDPSEPNPITNRSHSFDSHKKGPAGHRTFDSVRFSYKTTVVHIDLAWKKSGTHQKSTYYESRN